MRNVMHDWLGRSTAGTAHARAAVTHDADANLGDLLAAYREILGGEVGT